MKKLERIIGNNLESFDKFNINDLGIIYGGAEQSTGSDSNGNTECIDDNGCVVTKDKNGAELSKICPN